MSTVAQDTPKKPARVNLRRPDIMEAVHAQVENHYRSLIIERLRERGNVLSAAGLTVRLAKEFGFCYGVERAIDLAYAARKVFPNQPIYILGEIIHNPAVNDQIKAMEVKFLSGKYKEASIEDLKEGDVVIIPAFGSEVETMKKLEAKGCQLVDTTCGATQKVQDALTHLPNEPVQIMIDVNAYNNNNTSNIAQTSDHLTANYLIKY